MKLPIESLKHQQHKEHNKLWCWAETLCKPVGASLPRRETVGKKKQNRETDRKGGEMERKGEGRACPKACWPFRGLWYIEFNCNDGHMTATTTSCGCVAVRSSFASVWAPLSPLLGWAQWTPNQRFVCLIRGLAHMSLCHGSRISEADTSSLFFFFSFFFVQCLKLLTEYTKKSEISCC